METGDPPHQVIETEFPIKVSCFDFSTGRCEDQLFALPHSLSDLLCEVGRRFHVPHLTSDASQSEKQSFLQSLNLHLSSSTSSSSSSSSSTAEESFPPFSKLKILLCGRLLSQSDIKESLYPWSIRNIPSSKAELELRFPELERSTVVVPPPHHCSGSDQQSAGSSSSSSPSPASSVAETTAVPSVIKWVKDTQWTLSIYPNNSVFQHGVNPPLFPEGNFSAQILSPIPPPFKALSSQLRLIDNPLITTAYIGAAKELLEAAFLKAEEPQLTFRTQAPPPAKYHHYEVLMQSIFQLDLVWPESIDGCVLLRYKKRSSSSSSSANTVEFHGYAVKKRDIHKCLAQPYSIPSAPQAKLALVLDLDGTLISSDPPSGNLTGWIVPPEYSRIGIPPGIGQFLKEISQRWSLYIVSCAAQGHVNSVLEAAKQYNWGLTGDDSNSITFERAIGIYPYGMKDLTSVLPWCALPENLRYAVVVDDQGFWMVGQQKRILRLSVVRKGCIPNYTSLIDFLNSIYQRVKQGGSGEELFNVHIPFQSHSLSVSQRQSSHKVASISHHHSPPNHDRPSSPTLSKEVPEKKKIKT